MGAFRLLAAIRTRPELRSVLKYDVMSSGRMSTKTLSPWTSWALSGSLSPSGPGQSSGQSQNIWRPKLRHDINDNTLTMDFMGAFRLLAAIRARPELRSVSKYSIWRHKLRHDVNDNTLTMDFMVAFRLFAAIRARLELRSVSIYTTSQAEAWCQQQHTLTMDFMHGRFQGYSPPSRLIRSSGQSQNVTSQAQTWRHRYSLTMDFMGAFRLLAAIRTRSELRSPCISWVPSGIRTRPELSSVSKYDVTSWDMMSSIHDRLQAPCRHQDQPRAQVGAAS
jgi:hypothetical protein